MLDFITPTAQPGRFTVRMRADIGGTVEARAGQIVHCDISNRPLEVVDSLGSGLGMNYRIGQDGTLSRVLF